MSTVHEMDEKVRGGFTPIAYEAEIDKDRDYILHLPNGEAVCVTYSEDGGPTFHVVMWPGDDKTYIEVRDKPRYVDAEELR